MTHKVNVRNAQKQIKVTTALKKLIRDCIRQALALEQFDSSSEVNILLTSNKNIRELNKDFRDIDSETDVLSFPILDIKDGKYIFSAADIDPDSGSLQLGDIVVSLERASEQAEEYGHSFERELGFLVTHGLFHLLGYDHDNGTGEMFEKQEKVLESLGLTREE